MPDLNLVSILQNGKGVESDYQEFKTIFAYDTVASSPVLPTNPKLANKSYMNEYAFISYGANYLVPNGSGANTFRGFEGGVAQSGLIADYDKWKNPTAKNIIEWSKELLNKQKELQKKAQSEIKRLQDEANKTNTGTGGGAAETIDNKNAMINKIKAIDALTRLKLPPSVGALEYEWKDFAFCKYFGSIPNNRLITLRRFKLPTLDSGAVIGKYELVDKVKSFGYNNIDYLNTDSARALTYFGEGTGNAINDFVAFNFSLSWESRNTQNVDIPPLNSDFGSGYNPFTAKNVLSDVLGGSLSEFLKSNQYASALGFLLQSQNAAQGDINITSETVQRGGQDQNAEPPAAAQNPRQVALENAPQFSPYEAGWQHRIYGPINVITRTYRRKRGVDFTGDSISLTFEYNVMQVDTLNPKLAMLDIISNILALTYADASFYGGDYRFLREPTDFPLPNSLVDQIQQYATGKEGVDITELLKSYTTTLTNVLTKIQDSATIVENNEIIQNLMNSFNGLLNSLNITKPAETTKDTKDTKDIKQEATVIEGINTKIDNISKALGDAFKIFSDNSGVPGEDIGANDINPLKYAASAILGKGYSISSIAEKMTVLTPLFTGEPIGEWHLTVGNPMNPFMMIGNLICTNCKLSFNDTLGPDDFPTQLKAEITLQHARERDKGDIESMFNMGQGRFYVNVEGQPEPWNTGFSSNDSGNDTTTPDSVMKARFDKEKSQYDTDTNNNENNDGNNSNENVGINNVQTTPSGDTMDTTTNFSDGLA